MKFNLKTFLSLMVILALAVSLVACGSAGQDKASTTDNTSVTSQPATSAATTSAPKEIVTLSLLMFTDYWNEGGWEDTINDVDSKADKLGFKLEVEKIAGGDQGNQIIKARYAAGELPDLHAYYNANSAKADVGIQNFIDISGDWTKNYEEGLIGTKDFTIDGKTYAVPWGSVNLVGMYYNKKVFSDLGLQIPNNWNEFLAACEKIKAAGKIPVYYSGKDAWTLQLIPIAGMEREVRAQNRSIDDIVKDINTNKMKHVDLKSFIDSLAKMKDLQNKGYINKTYLSDGYDSAQKALAEGTAAMYPMATWLSGELAKKYPDQVADIGAFLMPFDGNDVVPTFAPHGLLVTKGCKNPEAAKAFVNYFGSKEGQQVFFTKRTGIPAMKGIQVNVSPAEQDLMNYTQSRKSVLVWSELTEYNAGPLDKYCQDLMVGAKTPEQVTQEMDKEVSKSAKAKNDPNFQ